MRSKWIYAWALLLTPAGFAGDVDVSSDVVCRGTTVPGVRPRCIPLDAASLRNSTLTAEDVIALMPEQYEAKGQRSMSSFAATRSRPELPRAYFTAADVARSRGSR